MLAALLAAAAAASAAAPVPADRGGTAEAAPSASPQADRPDAAAANIADLTRLYDQSCHNRAYGEFDQPCEAMARQIHQYEAEQAAAARKAARAARAKPVRRP